MTAALPTGRQGQALALLLLLAAVAAAYLLIAAPLIGLYGDRQIQAEDRRLLLQKLHSVAAELPQLRARAAALRAAVDSRKLVLEGGSDGLASAALQGHLEQYAAKAGARIASTETLPTEIEGGYRRIGLRLLLNGRYESLVRLLSEIDAATPPLVVGDLQIRSTQALGAAPNVALNASLDVFGFRGNATAAAVLR